MECTCWLPGMGFCARIYAVAIILGRRIAYDAAGFVQAGLRVRHLDLPAPAAAAQRCAEQSRQPRARSASGPRQEPRMVIRLGMLTLL